LDANKPAAGKAGRIYFAVDTHIFYYDNGVAWEKAGIVDYPDLDEIPSSFTPSAHKTTHQDGGTDEINVAGLSGLLADPQRGLWAPVYEEILTEAATSKTINNLDGNTAGQYLFKCRIRNGYAGGVAFNLRLNGDSGTNYDRNQIYGDGASALASSGTGTTAISIGSGTALNQQSLQKGYLYAKSGYARQCVNEFIDRASWGVIGRIFISGWWWNNTADNITSLVIIASQTNGLGVGTYIGLFKRIA